MDSNLIVFLILAFVAVGSALGMLLNKNAVYSALFLILKVLVLGRDNADKCNGEKYCHYCHKFFEFHNIPHL